MTDAPERIRIKPCSPCENDGDWYIALTPGGVEYVRGDVSKAEIAALRAEVNLANDARDKWQDIAMQEMGARVAAEACAADAFERAARVAFESEDVYGAREMHAQAKAARNIAAAIRALAGKATT